MVGAAVGDAVMIGKLSPVPLGPRQSRHSDGQHRTVPTARESVGNFCRIRPDFRQTDSYYPDRTRLPPRRSLTTLREHETANSTQFNRRHQVPVGQPGACAADRVPRTPPQRPNFAPTL